MKKLIILWYVLFSYYVYADPFYTEQNDVEPQAVKVAQNSEKIVTKQTACHLPDNLNRISNITDFNQLNLVALIQIDQNFYAVLVNSKGKNIILNTNDFLTSELIEITKIDLTSVEYIDWSSVKECESPERLLLKL